MAQSSYAQVKGWLKLSEGGFSDDPKDPGNWSTGKAGKGELLGTNHGITGHVLAANRGEPVTIEDVRNLTIEEADKIYKTQYWDTVRGDQLPAGVDYCVFDYGVNSGPSRAIKSLQKSLGVRADGVIGPMTMAALNVADRIKVISDICHERWAFMKTLHTWPRYKNGWTARVMGEEAGVQAGDIGVIDRATMMVTKIGAPIPAPKIQAPQKAMEEDASALKAWLTPDGMAKGGMAVSGMGSIITSVFSGSGPIQYALAVALVVAAGVVAYKHVMGVRGHVE